MLAFQLVFAPPMVLGPNNNKHDRSNRPLHCLRCSGLIIIFLLFLFSSFSQKSFSHSPFQGATDVPWFILFCVSPEDQGWPKLKPTAEISNIQKVHFKVWLMYLTQIRVLSDWMGHWSLSVTETPLSWQQVKLGSNDGLGHGWPTSVLESCFNTPAPDSD